MTTIFNVINNRRECELRFVKNLSGCINYKVRSRWFVISSILNAHYLLALYRRVWLESILELRWTTHSQSLCLVLLLQPVVPTVHDIGTDMW